MKKYLSKKYIKYIGSLCAVWAALWNVFLLGVSLEKSGPAADSTLLQCILGSENYAHDFFYAAVLVHQCVCILYGSLFGHIFISTA